MHYIAHRISDSKNTNKPYTTESIEKIRGKASASWYTIADRPIKDIGKTTSEMERASRSLAMTAHMRDNINAGRCMVKEGTNGQMARRTKENGVTT